MDETNTIGARLRQARQERGLTQDELADRSGVSRDLIAKLEQERRMTARVTTLTQLANALGISLSGLLGRRERLGPLHDGGVIAVRNTVLAVEDLPGMEPEDGDGEPLSPADLDAAVRRGWDTRYKGRLGDLAALLPGLTAEARAAKRALAPAAAGALAQSYQLCADLLVHVGHDDLAAIAIERALAAAADGDDELQQAVLYGTAAWVYMHQGRPDAAEQVARTAADRIEPSLSKATPQQLTVWGALLLWAAAAAADQGHASETADYLGLARAAAGRFSEDRHDYWTNFGPTQVAMQAVHAAAVLERPSEALQAATQVRRADLLGISWGAHQLDVAKAYSDGRRGREAVEALSKAHSIAPEWFRQQGPARYLVRRVVEHERRLTPAMRTLAAAVGIN